MSNQRNCEKVPKPILFCWLWEQFLFQFNLIQPRRGWWFVIHGWEHWAVIVTHLTDAPVCSHLFTLNVKNINLFTAEKGRIELVYISIPQLLPDDSQPIPAGGELPGFSFMWSLGILRENAPATDLFIFELSISVVGQESQLVGLCTYAVLFMGLSFYVGETKLDFTTCFGARLGIYIDEWVAHIRVI